MLNGTQLRCLKKDEADEVMREIHAEVCDSHMNGIILAKKIVRQGYYWMSMEKDCIQTVRQCHQCQMYGNLNHLPPTVLNNGREGSGTLFIFCVCCVSFHCMLIF